MKNKFKMPEDIKSNVRCSLIKECPEWLNCKTKTHAHDCIVYRACVEKKLPFDTRTPAWKTSPEGKKIFEFRKRNPGLKQSDCVNILNLEPSVVSHWWKLTNHKFS